VICADSAGRSIDASITASAMVIGALGSAHLELAPDVVHLDPEPAMFAAMTQVRQAGGPPAIWLDSAMTSTVLPSSPPDTSRPGPVLIWHRHQTVDRTRSFARSASAMNTTKYRPAAT
jgi:hypothetical protein